MSGKELSGRSLDLGSAGTLHLGEVIKHYPGKRVLLKGSLSGREVIAKFYLGPWRSAYEWWRGLRGARALSRTRLPFAPLLYAGYCRQAGAWLAVHDWIEADEPWPPADRQQAMARLLQTLAEHHEAGITQNDLGWRNFIPSRGVLYTVDGDRVRYRGGPLGRKASLRHLLHMYASKSKIPDEEVVRDYRYYLARRGWEVRHKEEIRFLKILRRKRRSHSLAVGQRVSKGWKYYTQMKLPGRRVIYDRRILTHEQLKQLEPRLPRLVEAPATTWLETGGEMLRATAVPEGEAAMRAWIRLIVLRKLGLPAERHVALVNSHGLRLRLRRGTAWLVQRHHDTHPLRECLPWMEEEEKHRLREALETMLAILGSYRIRLGPDPASALGWDGQSVHLADVTGMRLHPWHLPGFSHMHRKETRLLQAFLQQHSRS